MTGFGWVSSKILAHSKERQLRRLIGHCIVSTACVVGQICKMGVWGELKDNQGRAEIGWRGDEKVSILNDYESKEGGKSYVIPNVKTRNIGGGRGVNPP